MRRFYLDKEDARTGDAPLAEGIQFSDGTVVLHLVGQSPPTVIHRTVSTMLHSHALPVSAVRWQDRDT